MHLSSFFQEDETENGDVQQQGLCLERKSRKLRGQFIEGAVERLDFLSNHNTRDDLNLVFPGVQRPMWF